MWLFDDLAEWFRTHFENGKTNRSKKNYKGNKKIKGRVVGVLPPLVYNGRGRFAGKLPPFRRRFKGVSNNPTGKL